MFALNARAPIFIWQILLNIKCQVHTNKVIVGYLDNPFWQRDRPSKLKVLRNVRADPQPWNHMINRYQQRIPQILHSFLLHTRLLPKQSKACLNIKKESKFPHAYYQATVQWNTNEGQKKSHKRQKHLKMNNRFLSKQCFKEETQEQI